MTIGNGNIDEQRLLKFYGLVGRMRKYQKQYFKSRMQYDKDQSIKYEGMVDEYILLLHRSGYVPIFEDDKQGKLFEG
jgi:hypothetical protein